MRIDDLLVARGIAASRDKAARIIMAGRVSAVGRRIEKPGERVDEDLELQVRASAKYVSRGGTKLEGALDAFRIEVREKICLDAGCSTGGFTDCLLQRNASKVYAVDVGYGQLAWSLRNDPRVVLHERTNIRSIDPADFDPQPSLVVADLSFVPLSSVIGDLAGLCAPGGCLVVLVKPQFELPRELVGEGVVRDTALREQAAAMVETAACAAGLRPGGRVDSAIPGAEGNREIFLVLAKGECATF